MSSTSPQLPLSGQRQFCRRCSLFFRNFDALHQHKVRSDRHHVCYVCSKEFITMEGLDRHCKQEHAHAQNLHCVVCRQKFTTLGGLTNHIESEVCSSVNLTALVKEKTALKVKMDAARHYQGGRSGGNMIPEDEPRPVLRDYSKDATQAPSLNVSIEPDSGAERSFQAAKTKAADRVSIEEDLISFDAPSQIMNGPWDEPLQSPLTEQFPVFASLTRPSGTPITANTPVVPASRSMVKELATLTLTTQGPTLPWDPENPKFNIATYYNEFSKTYRCPHQSGKSCKKPIQTKSAFIQHLKSNTHCSERLQCHGCLRYFDTATALAQHASSQGVRCKVRESDDYENEVDRFTAGHAATDGRFDDDTIRYVATGMPQTAKQLAESHRATIAEREEAKMSYWRTHRPRW